MWRKPFESLALSGGSIEFLLNDDEDMIEIRYPDGMLIDVGKALADQLYRITVVAEDSVSGWRSPLYEEAIADKESLPVRIQQVIHLHRNAH